MLGSLYEFNCSFDITKFVHKLQETLASMRENKPKG